MMEAIVVCLLVFLSLAIAFSLKLHGELVDLEKENEELEGKLGEAREMALWGGIDKKAMKHEIKEILEKRP